MARMGDLAGVYDYEQDAPDELLAPPAQPRPLNMLGDALYGLGRSLSGPAANPIQPAQDAAYGAFKGMTVDPVVEAYNAVKGRMTEDEQRNMLFGAAIGMLPMGRAAKGAVPSGIKVFHSSPHDFERFDASKIGTGEGAQVYGYGHYFAENPAVSGQGGEYWKQFKPRFQEPERGAAYWLELAKFDRPKAIESLTKMLEGGRWQDNPARTAERQAELALLKGGNPVGPRTYEVNLRARPEEFLDWDKPLASKAPVRGLIADMGMKGTGSPYADVRNAAKDAFLAAQRPEMTGEGAYRSLVRANIGSPVGEASVRASQALREAGIPGIKYLDQGSRAGANPIVQRGLQRNLDIAQQELAMAKQSNNLDWIARQEKHLRDAEAAINQPLTSNYVMFPGTEHLIDITKKYAIPTAVLGGLAARDRYEMQ